MSMETLQELQTAWNAQADKYNQWDELGHDEIVVFSQQRAASAERCRSEKLSAALTEIRDRIKDHPAYADLTMDEEIEIGGDTAELSYLARVADGALGA